LAYTSSTTRPFHTAQVILTAAIILKVRTPYTSVSASKLLNPNSLLDPMSFSDRLTHDTSQVLWVFINMLKTQL
jgi:hypothetical protein